MFLKTLIFEGDKEKAFRSKNQKNTINNYFKVYEPHNIHQNYVVLPEKIKNIFEFYVIHLYSCQKCEKKLESYIRYLFTGLQYA